jgi:predicted DsbA family dithiol-disulfide isomerase
VQQDVEEGTRAGVTGTPAFFINGRLLSGAQPLERFARVIEEELVQVRAASRPAKVRPGTDIHGRRRGWLRVQPV